MLKRDSKNNGQDKWNDERLQNQKGDSDCHQKNRNEKIQLKFMIS